MKKLGKIVSLLSSTLIVTPILAVADSVTLTPPASVGTKVGTITINSLSVAAIQIAMVAAFALAFAYLVWGGIDWIKSGGAKEDVGKAQGKITAAVIGMIAVLAAWAIMNFVGNLIGVPDMFKKGIDIPTLYP